MSESTPTVDVSPAPAANAAGRRRIVSRIMLALTLALGAYVGWLEGPGEIARWHLAAALESRTQAEHHRYHHQATDARQAQTRAHRALSQALAWNPRNGEVYLTRALWLEEQGQYEAALRDCEKRGVTYNPVELAVRRSSLLAHLGRHEQAVKEAQSTLSMSGVGKEWALNFVAYQRAIGKIDLPRALKEIEQSFGNTPPEARDAGRLDTRGFILYRLGRYREAIVDFDRAIAQAEAELAKWRRNRPELFLKASDYRVVEASELEQSRHYAVIYYHRSLVLQKLNRWKEAHLDLRKAEELAGRQPDEHLF